jgi:hypothetical protein
MHTLFCHRPVGNAPVERHSKGRVPRCPTRTQAKNRVAKVWEDTHIQAPVWCPIALTTMALVVMPWVCFLREWQVD